MATLPDFAAMADESDRDRLLEIFEIAAAWMEDQMIRKNEAIRGYVVQDSGGPTIRRWTGSLSKNSRRREVTHQRDSFL